MNKIAMYKEKTETMKSKIRRALFYPVAVLVVAAVITYILLVFVVPQFETLYSGLGADLPVPTQIVIALSVFLQKYGWMVILLAIGGVYMFIKAKRTNEALQTRYDAAILKLPVVGEIVRKATIARYARTLGTMFAAGVPLVEALESVSGATGNNVYRDAIVTMRGDVATGQQLQLAMQQSKLFPNMAVQMVAIGEESGSLDGMLSKIADFYEQEVDEAVEGMSSLMEPVIMVVLGSVIGSLVVAMYLPIFKMGQIL
jgi:type IV pilus assembly protein PilC